nr:SIR2 family protein [uncultured Trichococcus sp.]
MNINDFVGKFTNHPVLFIGTGISLRYLDNSYTWDGLLRKISLDLYGNLETYFDIKGEHVLEDSFNYPAIASRIEADFNSFLIMNRDGKFKFVNDIYYKHMENNSHISRFKIYLSELFSSMVYRESKSEELLKLKKVRKNIGSVITTNYDSLVEEIFGFTPLIGNNILLSNPYGSVYKVHGSASVPDKIIITDEDYLNFNKKYELIRAQLLSLFIHNPIIFMGYNIGDSNIKAILKTIFSYVEPNSEQAELIRRNFLLVEYDPGSESIEVVEHDIDLTQSQTIRINKIKTDDYNSIYNALAALQLPVSAMDVRKVQTVVKDIYSGGSIKVRITEDLDQLNNSDKVLVIGSDKTISYEFQTVSEMMANYFSIIEEENIQILSTIDKLKIQSQQYFPMYGFSTINQNISSSSRLRTQQETKLTEMINNINSKCKGNYKTIDEIERDESLAKSYQVSAIIYGVMQEQISLTEVEAYLKKYTDKQSTDYRKLLCAYDFIRYK